MKIVFVVLIIAVLGFLGIRYFLFKIGDPVNLKVSDSYFYHYRKKIIVYSPMGNWFELGYFESDADFKSFQPINRDFGKDKEHVYWKGRKQTVDYATFEIDSSGILKDKNHVYCTDGKEYDFLEIIPNADPKTYQLLDPSFDGYKRLIWFKDANAVFYKNKKIIGDPKTFKPLNDAIAIDSDFIYSIIHQRGEGDAVLDVDEVLQKHKIIEGEIRVISESYVQIGNAVVSAFTKEEFSLHTFELVKSIKDIDYWTITVNDTIIYKGVLYPEIDGKTFEPLDFSFSKDNKNVYYECQKINEATPDRFEVLSEHYLKDDKKVYYKNGIVADANPQTFKRGSEYDVWEDGKYTYKNGNRMN